jgi:hypothetical protein
VLEHNSRGKEDLGDLGVHRKMILIVVEDILGTNVWIDSYLRMGKSGWKSLTRQ